MTRRSLGLLVYMVCCSRDTGTLGVEWHSGIWWNLLVCLPTVNLATYVQCFPILFLDAGVFVLVRGLPGSFREDTILGMYAT